MQWGVGVIIIKSPLVDHLRVPCLYRKKSMLGVMARKVNEVNFVMVAIVQVAYLKTQVA